MKKNKILPYIFLALGLTFVGFGVQVVVYSNLGAAPLDAFTYYVARIYLQIFKGGDFSTHKSVIGPASLIVGVLVVAILLLLTKNKKILLSIVNLTIISVILGLWGMLFDNLAPIEGKILLRFLMAVGGITILSLGVYIILRTGLPGGPHEELLIYINKKIPNLFLAKVVVEGIYFVLAFIAMVISTAALDKSALEFTQIGPFTIFTIVLASLLIHTFDVIYNKVFIKNKQDLKEELQ